MLLLASLLMSGIEASDQPYNFSNLPGSFQDWFLGGAAPGPNTNYNIGAFNSWTPEQQNYAINNWQGEMNGDNSSYGYRR